MCAAEEAHGIVMPLVTTARDEVRQDGSRRGLVGSLLTKPYRFYQFWLNVDDRDAGRY